MINWLAQHGPSLVTVGFFIMFLVIGFWAYSPANRQKFQNHGAIPWKENDHGE